LTPRRDNYRNRQFRQKQKFHGLKVKQFKSTPRDKINPSLFSGELYFKIRVLNDYNLIVKSGSPLLEYDEALINSVLNLPESDLLKQDTSIFEAENVSTFIRIGDKITIPGTTLKGMTRARLELSFIPKSNEIDACFITRSKGRIGYKQRNYLKGFGYNNNITERWQCKGGMNVCFVCNIFGSMGLRAKVNFSDAELVKGSMKRVTLDVGRGHSNEEIIGDDGEFQFKISFENLERSELGAIFYALNTNSDKTVLIGSHKYGASKDVRQKTVRLGKCKITATKILTFPDLFKIKEEDVKSFIAECINSFKRRFQGRIRELKDWEVY